MHLHQNLIVPCAFPFCDDRLPDIEMVSLVVIGASIACDIDMPDTSILGKDLSLRDQKDDSFINRDNSVKNVLFLLFTQTHHHMD